MEELANYAHDDRPWGSFDRYTLNESTTVKIISVNAGETLSLQTHTSRDEFWRVVKGSGIVHIGESEHAANDGNTFYIKRGEKHRVSGGPDGMTFLEIAFGKFDENDITRLDDKYGRS